MVRSAESEHNCPICNKPVDLKTTKTNAAAGLSMRNVTSSNRRSCTSAELLSNVPHHFEFRKGNDVAHRLSIASCYSFGVRIEYCQGRRVVGRDGIRAGRRPHDDRVVTLYPETGRWEF